jgi:nitrate reductase alpha subunit
MYESEQTKFMREYLEKHPEELESQRKGRAVWWDKEPGVRTQPVPVTHPPKAGGSYPLRLTGGHTRWSIHATWRDEPRLLRLQRGEPVVYMNDHDATSRGLHDNDRARVYNDVGAFEVLVKISAAVQPGQIISYHAWEPYQFRNWQGHQEVVASPLKPLHLVGDYGHLRYRVFASGPVHVPRGVAVEIERASA